MSIVLFYEKFNDEALDNGKTPLRGKFNEIIKDLEENNSTSQGNIKLIKGDGNIEYFRAKLSDSDRLLFTGIKIDNKDAFVILEVILNHDYHKSKFLTNREKIKNIEIVDKNNEEISDNVSTLEIEDAPQVSYLGKFITFSAKQEDIVERVKLPLVINGAAGSGKTSVALESLKRIKEKFEGGKILYITKSENLVKESKKLLEYEYYDDEFKIAAPEEIDFLSLHEFLEKQAEDIKRKKPINRSKFFLWFNEICKKDKFKKYKKDGDKIFEEFTAVIGGRSLLGEDGKDRYAKLGDRQSMFSVDERNSVYDFFKEYRKFIEKDSEYYDPNLVTNKCITEGMYDAIVVDEVQDLTESTLDLVLKSLKDENKSNFLLCGDVNQVIHPSFFSLSKLKSFLCQNRYIVDQGSEVFYTLEKNYRNSEQVIEFANRILHLKNYCFASEDKITVDNAFLMKSETKNKGNVGFIIDDKKEEIAKKVNESINCAVLALDDESKKSARQLFDTPLVFNIHEAKGLEFENVILYKFTSCKAYNEIWNIACPNKSEGEIDNTINRIRDSYNEREVNTSRNKDKKDKSLEKYKFYMNALYVGVTRAVDSVYIIDDESNLLKIIEPREEGNVNIEQEESSPEEWRNKALELIEKGNIEQAELIARKLQNEGKKEYAEEIMNVLRAKGYHEENQILDKNKYTNSVLESDISSRSSQSSEHEGKDDDIIKLQNENNQNKKKKAKKYHQVQKVKPQLSLEDSTNRKHNSKKPHNEKREQNQGNDQEKEPLKKNKELMSVICRDNINQFKKMDISQYSELEIFILAFSKASFKIVKYLVKEKKSIIDARNKKGFTFLHLAVRMGHLDIVKFLVKDCEFDVNAKSKEDVTPLHFAALMGHLDIVKFLVKDCEADVNARTKKGFALLHFAAGEGKNNVVKFLVKDCEADVNARNKEGFAPLHFAAKNGHVDIVKLLLKNKADVNVKTKEGSTPLLFALDCRHFEVADLLLADPNINVDSIKAASINKENKEGKEKFSQKLRQDYNLFQKVKEASNEKDKGKLDELLVEIEELLESKNKHGFKPSLNYSPDGNNENTTIEIAIQAGGKLLDLLYAYAKKNIGTDTEIFKRLKHAKENSQSKRDLCDVSVLKHSTPDQGFLFSNG
ncbi:ankyrin repeat domain-containing protein [Wolbachia endosymbiont (group B) of Pammene fasciana]|uniref:ankyrin repeat domain-containing protein n=1 Tax=Wolbachia endosymbiont (group B) of Pammene fasciana TaxID=2954037 RepID=UPI00223198E9|nr:ankyrin repeat domain-containing protein [Wolbachia endosymbiont (group B) of Pammene fasciana]